LLLLLLFLGFFDPLSLDVAVTSFDGAVVKPATSEVVDPETAGILAGVSPAIM
jgi:hypothetical protein